MPNDKIPTDDEAVVDGVHLSLSRQEVYAKVQKGIVELDAGMGIDGAAVFAELRARTQHTNNE